MGFLQGSSNLSQSVSEISGRKDPEAEEETLLYEREEIGEMKNKD